MRILIASCLLAWWGPAAALAPRAPGTGGGNEAVLRCFMAGHSVQGQRDCALLELDGAADPAAGQLASFFKGLDEGKDVAGLSREFDALAEQLNPPQGAELKALYFPGQGQFSGAASGKGRADQLGAAQGRVERLAVNPFGGKEAEAAVPGAGPKPAAMESFSAPKTVVFSESARPKPAEPPLLSAPEPLPRSPEGEQVRRATGVVQLLAAGIVITGAVIIAAGTAPLTGTAMVMAGGVGFFYAGAMGELYGGIMDKLGPVFRLQPQARK
ncbi:MAG: hypothetical protein PHF00_03410 [Elusimicrobia bacterium]|nr:hypothetical protein [Elusimicrobiota bacterium]